MPGYSTGVISPPRMLIWFLCLTSAVYFLFFLVAFPQFFDPFVRHDDYMSLEANWQSYRSKVIGEARWVGLFWNMRPWLWPASINFALYTFFWSTFCVSLAILLIPPKGLGLHTLAAGLLVAFNLFSVQHSLWFNTLIPGVFILAVFGALSLFVPPKKLITLQPFFVVGAFLSYTTYPMFILLVSLLAGRAEPPSHLIRACGNFLFSMVIAVIVGFGLNYLVFGIFGLSLEQWRTQPSTGADVHGLLMYQRAADFIASMRGTSSQYAFSAPAIALFVFCLTLINQISSHRKSFLVLAAVFFIGVIPLFVFKVTLGYNLTPYALVFAPVTILAGVAVGLKFRNQVSNLIPIVGAIVLLELCALQALEASRFYRTFDDWQSDTRILSELLDRSSKTIYFYGDPRHLESARRAHLYIKEDLALRLRNIDGLQITYCVERGNICPDVAGFEWETSAVTGIKVATDGRVSALRVE